VLLGKKRGHTQGVADKGGGIRRRRCTKCYSRHGEKAKTNVGGNDQRKAFLGGEKKQGRKNGALAVETPVEITGRHHSELG